MSSFHDVTDVFGGSHTSAELTAKMKSLNLSEREMASWILYQRQTKSGAEPSTLAWKSWSGMQLGMYLTASGVANAQDLVDIDYDWQAARLPGRTSALVPADEVTKVTEAIKATVNDVLKQGRKVL